MQLEVMVGETLKQLRRNVKDKKKALATNKKANKSALAAAVKEWKGDFSGSLASMMKNIEKLNAESIKRGGWYIRAINSYNINTVHS